MDCGTCKRTWDGDFSFCPKCATKLVIIKKDMKHLLDEVIADGCIFDEPVFGKTIYEIPLRQIMTHTKKTINCVSIDL